MTVDSLGEVTAGPIHSGVPSDVKVAPDISASDQTRARKILVVDDDEEIRFFMRMLLQTSGFEVITARDGVEALYNIKVQAPELIILDISMEGMDGMQVLGLLRANESTAEVPIILLSALDSGSQIQKGLSVGANCYITKPFDPTMLIAKLHELLGES